MSWKSLTCVTVFCALLAGQAMAVPTLSVTGSASGANTLWTVSVTPDATLLAAGEGAVAMELALEFPTTQTLVGGLAGITIDPLWRETINGVQIVNPGANPYTGTITEGATSHPNVPSEIGAGNVNAIFAALGSTKFTTNGPKTVMTFATSGTNGSIKWDGFLAQDEDGAFVDVSGMFPNAPTIPGDTDNDGDIDLQDLFNVQNNFGLPSPPNTGDTDGDGDIDLQDLFNVQNNFGLDPTPGALAVSASAVPEPATLALLSLCGIGALGVARIRRK